MDRVRVTQHQTAGDAEDDVGSSVDLPPPTEATLSSEADLDVSAEIRGLSTTVDGLSDITHGTEDLNANDDDQLDHLPSHSTPVPGGFYSLVAVDNSDAEEDESEQTMTKRITSDKIDPIYEKDIDETEHVNVSEAVIATVQPTTDLKPPASNKDTDGLKEYQEFQRISPAASRSGDVPSVTLQTENEGHVNAGVGPQTLEAKEPFIAHDSVSTVSHPDGTESHGNPMVTDSQGIESLSDSILTHPHGAESCSNVTVTYPSDTASQGNLTAALKHGIPNTDALQGSTEAQQESSSDSTVAQHSDIGSGSDSTVAPDSSTEQAYDVSVATQHDTDMAEQCTDHGLEHVSDTREAVASKPCTNTLNNSASILSTPENDEHDVSNPDTREENVSRTRYLIPRDAIHKMDTKPDTLSAAIFTYSSDENQSNSMIRNHPTDSEEQVPDLSMGTLKPAGREELEPFVLHKEQPSTDKLSEGVLFDRTPHEFETQYSGPEREYHQLGHSASANENRTSDIRSHPGANVYGNKFSHLSTADNKFTCEDYTSPSNILSSQMYMYHPHHTLGLLHADTNEGDESLPVTTADENIYENNDDIAYDSLDEDDHITSVSDIGGQDQSEDHQGDTEHYASVTTSHLGYDARGVNDYPGYNCLEDDSSVISDVCTDHLALPVVRNQPAVLSARCDNDLTMMGNCQQLYPVTPASKSTSPTRVQPVVSQTLQNSTKPPYTLYTMEEAMQPGVLLPGQVSHLFRIISFSSHHLTGIHIFNF